MDSDTHEPVKLIPCELCGAEAKLLCFCRKCSLCESCIGRHLVSEPSLGHKPVTFNQSEIAMLYEKEFSQIREHEQRLMVEANERQEFIKIARGKLREEITKLEAFKCTCLEYVALAVEMSRQKLAEAAHLIGKEMVEKCEAKRKVLESALKALENNESHWLHSWLCKDKAQLWNGHIDVKEVNVESALRTGIEFQLSMEEGEYAPVVEIPAVLPPAEVQNLVIEPKRQKEKATPQKVARKSSMRPEPSTPCKSTSVKPEPAKSVQTPRATVRTMSRKHTAESGNSEPPDNRKKPSRLRFSHAATEEELPLIKKDSDYPSPEPPQSLQRGGSSPSSASSANFGFGLRTSLIQQTAKNVSEVSEMLKSLKSPRGSDVAQCTSFSQKMRSSLTLSDLGSANPFDSPMPKTARAGTSKKCEFIEDVESERSLGSSSRSSFPVLPEVIPEEPQRDKARLYYITPGSTNMLIRDIEAGVSTVKTFEGIDSFPKMTFWCSTPSGEVFILGGVVNEAQPSTIKKTCQIYSSTYDTIEPGPSMIAARYACSAICVKDAIFVSGGVGSEMSAIKDCEKLDLRGRKWKRVANMNIPRESHGMTYHAGRIYVAGAPGEQSLETYNPVNDRWALLHFKVSAGGKACICSLGDKIAILHDKSLTFAWVDKRTSENVQELEEKGWWLGGPLVKSGDCYHFQRLGVLYSLSLDRGELRKADVISLSV